MTVDADLALSRRINGERLVVLGWPRAILLQLAHPLVAAGVHDHSGFRASPAAAVGRLRATVRAMLAIAFGDEPRRTRAIEGIRAIHRRVSGTLKDPVGPFPSGTPYSAEDPALLLWVHTTLIESTVLTYERCVSGLTDAERDTYCAASAFVPVALGVAAGGVPCTWHEIVAFNQRTIGTGAIAVGPQARALANALLAGPVARAVPPAAWFGRLVTIGLLPSPVRAGYGFDWNERRARTFDRVTSSIRRVRHVTPGVIARFADARRDR